MEKDIKNPLSVCIIVIGTILLIVGLFIRIPSKELTTESIFANEESVIEEYVGGDAYNYIIGASLVGGEIAGAKAQKAIFISVGLLIICFGLYVSSISTENSMFTDTSSAPKQNTGNQLSKLAREIENERTQSNGFWVCEGCGTKNDASNLYCKDCGKYK